MTTARDIMTDNVRCVQESQTATEAAKLMADMSVGALPICGSDDRLKGMLTDRDIAIDVVAKGTDPDSVTAGELAKGEVITIGADDDATEIIRTMSQYKVRRLPVIDGHKLVGIVALADAARALDDPQVADLLDALSTN